MKKLNLFIIVLAVGLITCGITNVLGFSAEDYKDFEDQGIVFSPGKAYYPTVIHNGANYLMLYDKPASYAISDDGIAWTSGGAVTGLTNPTHMVMLYDANGFGGGDHNYKIWYFDSMATIPNGANSIRYAESTNGISWTNDQAVFGGNMIVSGGDNVPSPSRTWGPGTVLYNPDAANTGNPMDYSYVMYYDGYNGNTDDSEWDNTEALFLAYSADGISWNGYTTNPVLKGGLLGEWDNGGVGYPTVMKIEDTYIMWYGGGAGTNEGIGFATSPDGITWTKDSDNPMFHVSDVTDPAGYRASRTYTPRVIDDGSNVLKMYYSAKNDSGVYAVGLATMSKPVTKAEAGIDINPDTLNLESKGKWITCYIELPEGYDMNNVDVSTVMLNWQVQAENHPTEIGDYDNDGNADLMVKFDRSEVQEILECGDNVAITIIGELTDGAQFEGTDYIRVI